MAKNIEQPQGFFRIRPPPFARATPKSQILTETTPTIALTRGAIYKGQSGTWFQKLRKQHLLLL